MYIKILEFRVNSSAPEMVRPGFPREFGKCGQLVSPDRLYLQIGKPAIFEIRTDKKKVAVIQNQKWYYLEHAGPGVFRGTVEIVAEKVTLNGNEGSNRFVQMFEFKGYKEGLFGLPFF